ncbi:MerR family transcriptional regulator [Rhodococcus sp. SRB_17]|uniref:MerR family transcriptional regulator n=1 Tax=Acidovorax sp. SRB_24 TaxID=1962700 RepID=UPI00145D2840|nr:helix-turn-helix domain-containing protein [Acidovorax sp. SRB_24]NMM75198.1 MerR family transcriptional regulator [Acidovorax sp. SRB_24]NMM88582.1 MerR family transcriptional regulator [Rhodococcus sp. SRB_17]
MNNPSALLTIGALAQRTGLNVSAIRYYEEVGLIPEATRRPSGHRVYGAEAQEQLTLIRHCRDFGFSVDDTKALVSLAASNDKDCVEAREIAQVHLDTVRAKLAELLALERSLSKFVTACTEQCVGGPAPKCTILKDLSLSDSALEAKQAIDASASKRCCG